MNKELIIKNLHCEVDNYEILKGVNLTIKAGEIHAIMGPNGTGKSTLAAAIMGHYRYKITKGEITLNGEDVLKMTVDERSRKGIFLAMQYPSEIGGVTNSDFIRQAMSARLNEGEHLSWFKFFRELEGAVADLKMNSDLPNRYLNEGFSGGEKKRNEILQMKLLKPTFAILDEIDSGLDVDALKIVGENVNKMKSPDFGALVITHYERLLDYLDVDHVHIFMDGRIVLSGGKDLIKKIDQEGYAWLRVDLGITEKEKVILGTCQAKRVK